MSKRRKQQDEVAKVKAFEVDLAAVLNKHNKSLYAEPAMEGDPQRGYVLKAIIKFIDATPPKTS